jgi:hypothetical protein
MYNTSAIFERERVRHTEREREKVREKERQGEREREREYLIFGTIEGGISLLH